MDNTAHFRSTLFMDMSENERAERKIVRGGMSLCKSGCAWISHRNIYVANFADTIHLIVRIKRISNALR
jgi:hypothetical protein